MVNALFPPFLPLLDAEEDQQEADDDPIEDAEEISEEEALVDIEELASTVFPTFPMEWKGEEEIQSIQKSLLKWYDTKEVRSMPWRVLRDEWEAQQSAVTDPAALTTLRTQRAYEVWVSEVMLQQTRVQTVIDFCQLDLSQSKACWGGRT